MSEISSGHSEPSKTTVNTQDLQVIFCGSPLSPNHQGFVNPLVFHITHCHPAHPMATFLGSQDPLWPCTPLNEHHWNVNFLKHHFIYSGLVYHLYCLHILAFTMHVLYLASALTHLVNLHLLNLPQPVSHTRNSNTVCSGTYLCFNAKCMHGCNTSLHI